MKIIRRVFGKIFNRQSELTFKGIHKSYTNYDDFAFKHNEVLTDQPIYFGFSVIEISFLLMYGTYFDKLQLKSRIKYTTTLYGY